MMWTWKACHTDYSQESFKYLGSVIQDSGDIDDGITHRIEVAQIQWRLVSLSLV